MDAQCQGWTLSNNERAALNHLALFNRWVIPTLSSQYEFMVRRRTDLWVYDVAA